MGGGAAAIKIALEIIQEGRGFAPQPCRCGALSRDGPSPWTSLTKQEPRGEAMPVTANAFLAARLQGRLWHTTQPQRFAMIMASGNLLPDPPIDDKFRWHTGGGPDHYPFVRSLGGVSLFDFSDFDPIYYDASYPVSKWRHFVPHRMDWCGAVWIEIRIDSIRHGFRSGRDLLDQWNKDKAHGHVIMPLIEAAHIGAVPLDAFKSAFLACQGGDIVQNIPLAPFRDDDFQEQVRACRITDSAKNPAR